MADESFAPSDGYALEDALSLLHEGDFDNINMSGEEQMAVRRTLAVRQHSSLLPTRRAAASQPGSASRGFESCAHPPFCSRLSAACRTTSCRCLDQRPTRWMRR